MNKSNILDSVFQTTVSVIVTGIVLFILSYLTISNGKISEDEKIEINNKIYTIVEIENSSMKTINNLKILIPINTDIKEIYTTYPLTIEENKNFLNNKKFKQILIKDIQQTTKNKIFVPTKKKESIHVTNWKELNLELVDATILENPILNAFYFIIKTMFAYFIVLLFIGYYNNKKINESIEASNTLSEKLILAEKKFDKRNKEMEKKAIKLEKRHTRLKAMLLARLMDYTKELDFWRNTIRKVIYGKINNKNNSQILIDEVTKSLKTYKTRDNKDLDFATLELLDKLSK